VTRELWIDAAVAGYGHGSEGEGGGWPGLRQVLLVRTTRRLADGCDVPPAPEDHYWLTSLAPGSRTPEQLLELVRGHWRIENELHHVKDRTMGEDAQRHRPGAAMAARLRSLAVGLLRHVAGDGVPGKQARLGAMPRLALKLLRLRRKPRRLL